MLEGYMLKDDKISKLELDNLQNLKRIEELKAKMKSSTKAHKAKVTNLKEKLEDININFELEKAKGEITSNKNGRLQKIDDEL